MFSLSWIFYRSKKLRSLDGVTAAISVSISPSTIQIGWLNCLHYDEAIKLEHTKQMASLIPGSTLILPPNLSHFVMWQDAEAFNAVVLKSLEMK
jgi:hypothetical protein